MIQQVAFMLNVYQAAKKLQRAKYPGSFSMSFLHDRIVLNDGSD